jgi:hypothetical protein
MESLSFLEDIRAFGSMVADFPAGVCTAFEELIQKTGDPAGTRNFYGRIEMKDGRMMYFALAEEKFSGEGSGLGYEEFEIDKGNYLCAPLVGWRDKIQCIKELFYELMEDTRVDKTKPAIEWYQNDDKMLCLVKMKN